MRRYQLDIRGRQFVVDVQELAPDRFQVVVGGESFEVRLAGDEHLPEATITPNCDPVRTGPSPPIAAPPLSAAPRSPSPAPAASGILTAPMPGVITNIAVQPGDTVARGQQVVVLEAMKMMNSIKAPRGGVIAEVCVTTGQAVGHGDLIIRFQVD